MQLHVILNERSEVKNLPLRLVNSTKCGDSSLPLVAQNDMR
jgi:hypothetical protein